LLARGKLEDGKVILQRFRPISHLVGVVYPHPDPENSAYDGVDEKNREVLG
jgi:hypothetical protein